MTSAELLQQQLNATKRKPKGVSPDFQAGIRYNAQLHKIVREVNADIVKHILPLIKSLETQYTADTAITTRDGWADVLAGALDFVKGRWDSPRFAALARDIATKFVRTADQTNSQRNARDLGINVYGNDTALQEYIDASIYDNARLIKSLPSQYLTQIESIVMTNVRSGGTPGAIAKLLQKELGVAERRAKLIARDQTAKINSQLTQKRQTAAGYEYFQWVDSHDERVRDRHEHINDKVTQYGKGVYRWDYLPLSDRGTPIAAGEDFQCRCIARPVSQREVDENIKAGRVRKGVKR